MKLVIVAVAQYLFILIALVAAVFWLVSPRSEKLWLSITWAFCAPLGFALTKLAGALYFDPRPFVSQHVAPLFEHAPDNGFPSDHTVLITIIALTVWQRSRRLGSVLLILGLLVGSARVMARVHRPLDIAGGVVIGLVTVLAAIPATAMTLRVLRKTAQRMESTVAD